mmetsp:Transcript_65382/g.174217  ORF Transcript_65382/g.174217 Transcript_65382/m.174217 type:complete len:315 (-) Transcript_65382:178-1122(-)
MPWLLRLETVQVCGLRGIGGDVDRGRRRFRGHPAVRLRGGCARLIWVRLHCKFRCLHRPWNFNCPGISASADVGNHQGNLLDGRCSRGGLRAPSSTALHVGSSLASWLGSAAPDVRSSLAHWLSSTALDVCSALASWQAPCRRPLSPVDGAPHSGNAEHRCNDSADGERGKVRAAVRRSSCAGRADLAPVEGHVLDGPAALPAGVELPLQEQAQPPLVTAEPLCASRWCSATGQEADEEELREGGVRRRGAAKGGRAHAGNVQRLVSEVGAQRPREGHSSCLDALDDLCVLSLQGEADCQQTTAGRGASTACSC